MVGSILGLDHDQWAGGEYKQWNGLVEWNTGLDYWTAFLDLYTMFYMVFVLLCIYPDMS